MSKNYDIAIKAISDVINERKRQDIKWGEQNHDPFLYATILMEEVGEFCQDALKLRFDSRMDSLEAATAQVTRMRTEAIQVAAVAVAIVECIDRDKWMFPTPEVEGA